MVIAVVILGYLLAGSILGMAVLRKKMAKVWNEFPGGYDYSTTSPREDEIYRRLTSQAWLWFVAAFLLWPLAPLAILAHWATKPPPPPPVEERHKKKDWVTS